MRALKSFLLDERGAAALEYGLVAALIASIVFAAVRALNYTSWFQQLSDSFALQLPS